MSAVREDLGDGALRGYIVTHTARQPEALLDEVGDGLVHAGSLARAQFQVKYRSEPNPRFA